MSTDAKTKNRRRYRGFESIAVPIVVRVGRTRMSFAELSELVAGKVIALDSRIGTPFELLARGDRIGGVEPIAADDEPGITLKLVDAGEQGADDDAS